MNFYAILYENFMRILQYMNIKSRNEYIKCVSLCSANRINRSIEILWNKFNLLGNHERYELMDFINMNRFSLRNKTKLAITIVFF